MSRHLLERITKKLQSFCQLSRRRFLSIEKSGSADGAPDTVRSGTAAGFEGVLKDEFRLKNKIVARGSRMCFWNRPVIRRPILCTLPWPDTLPFDSIRRQLRVYYNLRINRWLVPCRNCERPAHPIRESGFWYWCPSCLCTFPEAEHDFYFNWKTFLNHEHQELVLAHFYGRKSRAIWWQVKHSGPRSESDPTTVDDYCLSAIVEISAPHQQSNPGELAFKTGTPETGRTR